MSTSATVDNLVLRIMATGGKAAAAEVEGVKGSVGGLGSTAKAAGGIMGLGALAFGLKDITQAAINFQAKQSQLQGALKNMGEGSAANVTKMTDAAETLSQHGGFDATTSISGMTRLITAHIGVKKAIQDETLVTDMARRAHIPYQTALRAVMLVEQGRTTGLARLGIVIPPLTKAHDALVASHLKLPPALAAAIAGHAKLTPAIHAAIAAYKKITPEEMKHAKELDKQKTSVHAMSELWKRFGGAVADYSKTAAGGASNLRNQIEVLARKLGTALLPTITKVIHALSDVVTFFMKNKDAAKALEIGLGALAALWAIGKIAAFIGWLGRGVEIMKAWTVVTWLQNAAETVAIAGMLAWDAAMALPLLTIGAIVVAVAAVIAIVVLLITHFNDVKRVAIDVFNAVKGVVVDTFNGIKSVVMSVVTWFAHAVMYFVDAFRVPFNAMAPIVVGVFNVIKSVIGGVVSWLAGVAKQIFDWLSWPFKQIGGFVSDHMKTIQTIIGGVISVLKTIWSGLETVLTAPFRALWNIVQELIGPITTVINAAQSIIGSLGTSTHSTSGTGTQAQKNAAQSLLGRKVGGLATGGDVTGSGVFNVGEHGKERVFLPAGSAVVPNHMLDAHGSGGQTLENHITFQVGAIEFARAVGYSVTKAQAVR